MCMGRENPMNSRIKPPECNKPRKTTKVFSLRMRAYRALALLLPVFAFGVRPKNKVEFGGGAGFSDHEWVETSCGGDETRYAEKAVLFGFALAYERDLWREILSLRLVADVTTARFKEWRLNESTGWILQEEGYMQLYTGLLRLDANFRYAGVGLGWRLSIPAGTLRSERDEIPLLDIFYCFPTGFVRLGPRMIHFIMSFNDTPPLFEGVAPYPIPLSGGFGMELDDWYAKAKLSWLGLLQMEAGYRFLPGWWIGGEFAVYPGRSADHKGAAGRFMMKTEF